MFKKVLSTTVLGVSALGMMMVANAATCPKSVTAPTSTIMAANNAATSGVYVTGQIGYANTHMGSKTALSTLVPRIQGSGNNLSNNGLAGRLALGYQFNKNLAIEAGYLQLGQRKVNLFISPEQASLKLQQNAIDFVGKGIIPVANNVNVYGKLGVAYVTSNINQTVKKGNTPTATNDLNDLAGVNKHIWAPEVAVGVSYDIASNVSVDTSWTHIQPLGHNKPGNIDFVAVGLGYNFG